MYRHYIQTYTGYSVCNKLTLLTYVICSSNCSPQNAFFLLCNLNVFKCTMLYFCGLTCSEMVTIVKKQHIYCFTLWPYFVIKQKICISICNNMINYNFHVLYYSLASFTLQTLIWCIITSPHYFLSPYPYT